MKKCIIIIMLTVVILSSCYYSAADEFIKNHTEHDFYDDTPDGFVVDFLMESVPDLLQASLSSQDFLAINKLIYDYTGNTFNDLKSVTMWVSASPESWDKFNRISPDGSESYASTAFVFYDNSIIDAFILAVNCVVWRDSNRKDLVYYYVHELVHFIASQEHGGDSDHKHQLEQYWGENGLLNQLLEIIQEAAIY